MRSAVKSILNQTNQNFQLVVSDNSESDDAVSAVQDLNSSTCIVKRKDTPSIHEHWTACLNECKTTFIVLFHDDDEMKSNFVERFWHFESQNNYFAAVGFNAEVFNGSQLLGESFFSNRRVEGPISPDILFNRYFFKFSRGIAPFPGYVYRTLALKKVAFTPDTGKYGDVRLLTELDDHGGIFWTNEITFDYHIHGANDGLRESRRDRMLFLVYLKNTAKYLDRRTTLADYRYFFYSRWFSVSEFAARPYLQPVLRFQRQYRMRRLLRSEFYRNLAFRLLFRKR